MNISEFQVYVINGKEFITIEDFCQAVGRTRTAINVLIKKGNKHRKLKSFRPSTQKSFIPLSEYYEFPFTEGNSRNRAYNFSPSGDKIFNQELNKEKKEFDNEYRKIASSRTV